MNDSFLTKDEVYDFCYFVSKASYNGLLSDFSEPCLFYYENGMNERDFDDYDNVRKENGIDTNVFSSDYQFNTLNEIYTHFDDFQYVHATLPTSIHDKYLEKKNSSNHSASTSVDVSQYYNDIFPNVDIVSNTFISSVTFVIGFVILILAIRRGIKYFVNIIKYKGFGSGLAKQDYDMYLSDKVNEDHENNFDL